MKPPNHTPLFSITFFKVRIGEPATLADVETMPGKWFFGGRRTIRDAANCETAEEASAMLDRNHRIIEDSEFEIVWEIVEYADE